MLCVVFPMSQFIEKNPNMILGDESLLSQGVLSHEVEVVPVALT
jgi:hypothetical protein